MQPQQKFMKIVDMMSISSLHIFIFFKVWTCVDEVGVGQQGRDVNLVRLGCGIVGEGVGKVGALEEVRVGFVGEGGL